MDSRQRGRLQTGNSTRLEVVWRVSPYNACVVPILYRAYACAVRLALCVCSQTYASHVMSLGEGKPRLMLGWSRDRPRACGTSQDAEGLLRSGHGKQLSEARTRAKRGHVGSRCPSDTVTVYGDTVPYMAYRYQPIIYGSFLLNSCCHLIHHHLKQTGRGSSLQNGGTSTLPRWYVSVEL